MQLNVVDREWKWIDDGVLPYALALLRALWITIALHLYARAAGLNSTLISLPVAFLLLAGSTALAQYGAFRASGSGRFTLLLALAGLGAIVVTLYLAFGEGRFAPWDPRWVHALTDNLVFTFVVLVLAVWLWRWGILSGREPLLYDTFSGNFTLGIAAFALELAFAYSTRLAPLGEILEPLLLFFAIGLGALAISSLQSARRYEREQTGQTFALNRYWLGTVGGVIVVLLLIGLLVSGFFAPDEIARRLSGVSILLDLLARLLLVVAFILAYVLFAILEFFGRFIHLTPSTEQQPLREPPNLAEQFKDLNQPPSGISPEMLFILQVLAAVLIALVVVWIFAQAFRRFRHYGEEDEEESRESILSVGLLKEQLSKLFARRGNQGEAAAQPFAQITGDAPRERIRRTYQALLTWAAARGVPRSPAMTPNEYLALMGRALHLYVEPIWLITEAYLAARYGVAPISSDTADEVARAWEQIARENGMKR